MATSTRDLDTRPRWGGGARPIAPICPPKFCDPERVTSDRETAVHSPKSISRRVKPTTGRPRTRLATPRNPLTAPRIDRTALPARRTPTPSRRRSGRRSGARLLRRLRAPSRVRTEPRAHRVQRALHRNHRPRHACEPLRLLVEKSLRRVQGMLLCVLSFGAAHRRRALGSERSQDAGKTRSSSSWFGRSDCSVAPSPTPCSPFPVFLSCRQRAPQPDAVAFRVVRGDRLVDRAPCERANGEHRARTGTRRDRKLRPRRAGAARNRLRVSLPAAAQIPPPREDALRSSGLHPSTSASLEPWPSLRPRSAWRSEPRPATHARPKARRPL